VRLNAVSLLLAIDGALINEAIGNSMQCSFVGDRVRKNSIVETRGLNFKLLATNVASIVGLAHI
jgi:hypothetical protein